MPKKPRKAAPPRAQSPSGRGTTSPARSSFEGLIKSFGLVVRAHREANSISQERLAELAGLDRTYVGCIERGERNLGISNVAVLASALGVSAAQLLREAEELEKQEQPPGR